MSSSRTSMCPPRTDLDKQCATSSLLRTRSPDKTLLRIKRVTISYFSMKYVTFAASDMARQ